LFSVNQSHLRQYRVDFMDCFTLWISNTTTKKYDSVTWDCVASVHYFILYENQQTTVDRYLIVSYETTCFSYYRVEVKPVRTGHRKSVRFRLCYGERDSFFIDASAGVYLTSKQCVLTREYQTIIVLQKPIAQKSTQSLPQQANRRSSCALVKSDVFYFLITE
jgi:hypothetical protein